MFSPQIGGSTVTGMRKPKPHNAAVEIVDSAHGLARGTSNANARGKKSNINSSGNDDYYCNTDNKTQSRQKKRGGSSDHEGITLWQSSRAADTITPPPLCMPEDNVVNHNKNSKHMLCTRAVFSPSYFFFNFFSKFFFTLFVTCKRWSIYIYIIYMCNINIYIYIFMCVCVYTIFSS